MIFATSLALQLFSVSFADTTVDVKKFLNITTTTQTVNLYKALSNAIRQYIYIVFDYLTSCSLIFWKQSVSYEKKQEKKSMTLRLIYIHFLFP